MRVLLSGLILLCGHAAGIYRVYACTVRLYNMYSCLVPFSCDLSFTKLVNTCTGSSQVDKFIYHFVIH